jgi:hypothetical protein
MDSLKAEEFISITQFLGRAETCADPDMIGEAAGRRCGEAVVAELAELGYPKTAIIRGLRQALLEADRSLARS